MRRDDATVLDILRAAEHAVSFVEGMDRADFLGDVKTQSAVLHQLLVIGEAVRGGCGLGCEARDGPSLRWTDSAREAGLRQLVRGGCGDPPRKLQRGFARRQTPGANRSRTGYRRAAGCPGASIEAMQHGKEQ